MRHKRKTKQDRKKLWSALSCRKKCDKHRKEKKTKT